jgi:glycerol-3-phosphate dehydrogenase
VSPAPPVLSAARRTAALEAVGRDPVDLLVVGLGVTGAGVALDAASRGLSVVALDAEDLAFGTSRWSSKLVHGGLRYLAHGQVGVAWESAVERGVLMTRTAPHLTRTLPMVIPLTPAVSRRQAALAWAGLTGGHLLRAAVRTPRSLLPPPRWLSAEETAAVLPTVAREGLRGGLLAYDGQLVDDARLVVAQARTAAAHGASVLTRTRATEVTGAGAVLVDGLDGRKRPVAARAVVNATGVWAGRVVPGLALRPSRGSHLVLDEAALPGLGVAVSAPVPGSTSRFVFALPQPDGLVLVGVTDEPVDGELPEPAVPTAADEDFLLATIGAAFARPPGRADVAASYAGLRPLLRAEGETADLSRRHAVLVSDTGVVTVVGGKLTTYRRMAQDAVDAVVRRARLGCAPCRTRDLPLVGAVPRDRLAGVAAPGRLVRRYGAEAPALLAAARRTGLSDDELLAPVADGVPTTLAELLWGVTHEGALDVGDLLDRRTRVGLVPAHREAAVPAARRALAMAGLEPEA